MRVLDQNNKIQTRDIICAVISRSSGRAILLGEAGYLAVLYNVNMQTHEQENGFPSVTFFPPNTGRGAQGKTSLEIKTESARVSSCLSRLRLKYAL